MFTRERMQKAKNTEGGEHRRRRTQKKENTEGEEHRRRRTQKGPGSLADKDPLDLSGWFVPDGGKGKRWEEEDPSLLRALKRGR